jgi:hypothetical protein
MRRISNIFEGEQKENESTVQRKDKATGGWRKSRNEDIVRKMK